MENTSAPEIPDEHPLDKAARLIKGGRPALATHCAVSVAAIGNWKTRGVPLDQCVPIERATAGAVTRRDLRPDDWQAIWPELAETAQPIDIQQNQTQALMPPAQVAINTVADARAAAAAWDGVERRLITAQALDPEHGRREVDRPGAFPLVEGV